MAAQAMWLNIQCQWQSNLKLSKTNVQYENILFYFNLRWVHVGWESGIGLSPVWLRTCPSILQSVIPYQIPTNIQYVSGQFRHDTLDHAVAP